MLPSTTAASLRDALGRSRAIVATISDGMVDFVSDGARALAPDDASRRALAELLLGAAAEVSARPHMELAFGAPDGVTHLLSAELNSTPTGVVVVAQDVTESRERERELFARATTDALTALPNRRLLADRVAQALEVARRGRSSAALLFLDIDGFKDVNDAHGHTAGDELLRDVAVSLRTGLRATDTVARVGGDEFAILVAPPTDVIGSLAIARTIRRSMGQLIAESIYTGATGVTIGVALYPAHADTGAQLLERADAAMYLARRLGTSVAVYDSEHDTGSAAMLVELDAIGSAIRGGHLDLQFQPAVRLRDRRTLRVEALVRLPHATRGPLRPAKFLAMAEHAGLGPALDAWVLRAALARCRAWRDDGADVGVSVNVGQRDLVDGGLAARFAAELEDAGVEPSSLTVDVSEGVLSSSHRRVDATIRELSRVGVRIALDDFGSAGASLQLLRRLPFAEVKLDRNIVANIGSDRGSWSFIRGGIDAAHDLGLEVSAEGVEDEATAYLLTRLGCDGAQGQYFTRSHHLSGVPLLAPGELDMAP